MIEWTAAVYKPQGCSSKVAEGASAEGVFQQYSCRRVCQGAVIRCWPGPTQREVRQGDAYAYAARCRQVPSSWAADTFNFWMLSSSEQCKLGGCHSPPSGCRSPSRAEGIQPLPSIQTCRIHSITTPLMSSLLPAAPRLAPPGRGQAPAPSSSGEFRATAAGMPHSEASCNRTTPSEELSGE